MRRLQKNAESGLNSIIGAIKIKFWPALLRNESPLSLHLRNGLGVNLSLEDRPPEGAAIKSRFPAQTRPLFLPPRAINANYATLLAGWFSTTVI